MAKHSGIRALKKFLKLNSDKTPSVLTRRVAMAQDKNNAAADQPVSASAFNDPDTFDDTAADSKTGRNGSSRSSRQAVTSLNTGVRFCRKKADFIGQFSRVKAIVMGKRTREKAALDFAMHHRRMSKREKRKKFFLLYGGAGIVVAAVVLVVLLVPGGKAATGDTASAVSSLPNLAGELNSLEIKSRFPQEGLDVAAPETKIHAVDPLDRLGALDESIMAEPEVDSTQQVTIDTTQEGMPEESPASTPEATLESTPEKTPEKTPEATPIATTKPEETPPPVTMEECVKYFVVEADAYYNEMGYSSNYYEYTEDDVYMLAQIIDLEARGESFEGRVAVGNVVMNRVLNRRQFGNSVESVIKAPGQFAWNGSRSPSSGSKRAARAVLQDQYWVIPQDVYYFRSGASEGSDWGSHKFCTKIGGHCFYTHSYSGRHRGGSAPPKLFDRTYKYAQYGCKPEKRVYRIQYMLNKLGFDVKADRYFGKGTMDALKLFQEAHGLEADGVAGPATVKKLIKEYGLDNYYERFLAD